MTAAVFEASGEECGIGGSSPGIAEPYPAVYINDPDLKTILHGYSYVVIKAVSVERGAAPARNDT